MSRRPVTVVLPPCDSDVSISPNLAHVSAVSVVSDSYTSNSSGNKSDKSDKSSNGSVDSVRSTGSDTFVYQLPDELNLRKLTVDELIVKVVKYESLSCEEPVSLIAGQAGVILKVELTDQEYICVDTALGPVQIWLDNEENTSTTNKVTIKDLSVGSVVTHDIKIYTVNVMERYNEYGHLVYARDTIGYTVNTAGGCVTYRKFIRNGGVHWGIESQFTGTPRRYK